jgi:hypothetical protein
LAPGVTSIIRRNRKEYTQVNTISLTELIENVPGKSITCRLSESPSSVIVQVI